MEQTVGAIILAAGRGTRLNSTTTNKVALPFHGKPIIEYAVSVMEEVADPVVVVVGAFSDSVKNALRNHSKVQYATQDEQLGTGNAAKAGLDALAAEPPSLVLVGYGDHMMFYKSETVEKLIHLHREKHAAMSMITALSDRADSLAWGRIVRDANGNILRSVEHKDASDSERQISELNAGFYAFDYDFILNNINKIPQSPVTGEYYINSLIEMAVNQGKRVVGLVVPFEEVGIGINRAEELTESQKLHESIKNTV